MAAWCYRMRPDWVLANNQLSVISGKSYLSSPRNMFLICKIYMITLALFKYKWMNGVWKYIEWYKILYSVLFLYTLIFFFTLCQYFNMNVCYIAELGCRFLVMWRKIYWFCGCHTLTHELNDFFPWPMKCISLLPKTYHSSHYL